MKITGALDAGVGERRGCFMKGVMAFITCIMFGRTTFPSLVPSFVSARELEQVGVDRQGADALGRGGEDRIRHRRSNDGGRGLAKAAGGLGAFEPRRSAAADRGRNCQ